MRTCLALMLCCAMLLTLVFPARKVEAAPAQVSRAVSALSVTEVGATANGWSFRPAISADGQLIAFSSEASNLVSGDTNDTWDVFVRDQASGQVERASLASNGAEGDGPSGYWSNPAISGDGRYVAFASVADNLAPGDTNGVADVFVHDRLTGATERVSLASDGAQANGWSDWPALSADGRYVAFTSLATNLVAGDTNNARDIFVRDRLTGTTTRVSVASDGSQGDANSGWFPALSADGRSVAFSSLADNLVSGDTNHTWDVFVHDTQTGQTRRASVSSNGVQGNARSGYWSSLSLSADGSLVAFQSDANNLTQPDDNQATDVFVHDWNGGLTQRVTWAYDGKETNGSCVWPSLSPDGRFVTFTCLASNLVEKDDNGAWDVFLRDRANHTTLRVSTPGEAANSDNHSGLWSNAPVSNEGRVVAYASLASNLAVKDKNNTWDVFTTDVAALREDLIVAEARLDLGMPYCDAQDTQSRGCQAGQDCNGKFHDFNCGVCTDLVVDAYLAGAGFDLEEAVHYDLIYHPEHAYPQGYLRSAHDMWLYFSYTGQMLPDDAAYRPGDVAFFDWDKNGEIDHVAVVAAVSAQGRPTVLVDATGQVDSNPGGLANEMTWQPFYAQAVTGHGRLGGAADLPPVISP